MTSRNPPPCKEAGFFVSRRHTRRSSKEGGPMPSPLEQSARASFKAASGLEPTVLAQAPARVELLGNHTDYNGGLVLAAAIDRVTVIVGRPDSRREGRVRSLGFAEGERFGLDTLER